MQLDIGDMPIYGGAIGFNSNGIAECNACGWRGVLTHIDGEKVARPRYYFDEYIMPAYRVINTQELLQCPACGLFDDYETIEQELKSAKWGKIGRNAPCPCGSGKKFKKCCGG